MIIKNREELLSHGNITARKAVLDILEAGLAAGDPYPAVRDILHMENGKLIVGSAKLKPRRISDSMLSPNHPEMDEPLVFDLDKVGHIYVIGGGKAAQRQAQAIEDVLGDRITAGHVCAKKGDDVYLKRIGVTLAGHPLPDEDSVEGAKKIVAIAQRARKGDIVFHSESGGGTALLTLPAPGLTLQDLQDVNRVLYFEHGAPMPVANAVRNLLTMLRIKETRWVGEATYIRFSTDERPPQLRVMVHKPQRGNDFEYAIEMLKQYDSWDEIPESVRQFLLRADPAYANVTPEELKGKPFYSFRVMGPEYMLDAAQKKAEELGLNATVLVSSLSSLEASTIGDAAAYIAQEIEVYNRPIKAPAVVLLGGELVVTTGKNGGKGGRNQEFVLAAAPRIAGSERIVIGSADSDGSDGPTHHAGAIVDGRTFARAEEMGLDVYAELKRHNSNPPLVQLGDAIFTGVQKTNVQDLRVIYVGPSA